MKQKRVFLDELDNTAKAYKVKVKVIEKARPKKSPTKGTLYQSLVIEDDKGNRMRGALFGDQIDSYKEAFVYNGTYDIANAPIRRCDPQWKRDKDDLDYQMTFGNETIIQPLEQPNKDPTPDYKTISQIPKTASQDEKYDVLGLVVFVEAQARSLKKSGNRETFVRDIFIMDDCAQQPVTISAWNDLATTDCDRLVELISTPKVIAFTALKVSSYRGFSLTTTMSTTFLQSPIGTTVTKLQNWAYQNKQALQKMHSRISSVKEVETTASAQQISILLQKKDERHWLNVSIDEPDLKDMYAYIGCSKCGKRTDAALGEQHNCLSCSNIESIAVPRITFNCNVSDKTGTLPITAFATHTELLLETEARELFRIKQMNDKTAFEKIAFQLKQRNHVIQVGPKATLARNNVLQWVLKAVQEKTPAPDEEETVTHHAIKKNVAINATTSQSVSNASSEPQFQPSDSNTKSQPPQADPVVVQPKTNSPITETVALLPTEMSTDLAQAKKTKPTSRKTNPGDRPTGQQQPRPSETQQSEDLLKTAMPKLLQVKMEKGAQLELKTDNVKK